MQGTVRVGSTNGSTIQSLVTHRVHDEPKYPQPLKQACKRSHRIPTVQRHFEESLFHIRALRKRHRMLAFRVGNGTELFFLLFFLYFFWVGEPRRERCGKCVWENVNVIQVFSITQYFIFIKCILFNIELLLQYCLQWWPIC